MTQIITINPNKEEKKIKIKKMKITNAKKFLMIFLSALIFYHINGEPITQVDSVPAPYVAWSLASKGNFDLSGYDYLSKYKPGVITELPDGRWISAYPPGSAIAAVPFVFPVAAFHKQPLSSGKMRRYGKFVAAAYVSASVVLFYCIMSSLFSGITAIITTILLAAGTSLWSTASQSLWMHGPAIFFMILALYLLLDMPPHKLSFELRVILAGFFSGMAVLIRPTTIVFCLAIFVWFFLIKNFKKSLLFAIMAALPILFFIFYNHALFGNSISGGYGEIKNYWNTPFWLGLTGILLAPSRGLFIYIPAFLLVPVGVWAMTKNYRNYYNKSLLFTLLIASIATIFIYSKWHCWWGAWCYGPRMLCEIMPILAIFFGFGLFYYEKQIKKIAMILTTISILIQFIGIFGNNNEWNRTFLVGQHGKNLLSFKNNQIKNHALNLFKND